MAKRKTEEHDEDESGLELETPPEEESPAPTWGGHPTVKSAPVEDVAKPMDPDTHIEVDGIYYEHPEAKERPRRLLFQGRNVEHTGTDANGVWQYRTM